MVVSQSDGFIQNISLMDDLKVINSWHAHGYEAWISAFDYHNTQTVFTGGDDCLFKSWDLRADLLNSTFTSKKHDAGVCTIASHPLNEHIIATGSYDENIRIWDTRSLKNPLSTTNTKGGVWRIKWHHSDPNLLISANMYNNFHIYGSDPAFLTLEQLFIYEEHESIAYGVDWSRNESVHGDMIIGTCSFYDHLLNIWTFNKGITDCGALLCDDPWSAFC
jgi:diphthamide biosynthesis protein 7